LAGIPASASVKKIFLVIKSFKEKKPFLKIVLTNLQILNIDFNIPPDLESKEI